MESQLKKVEKEVQNLEVQYADVINQITQNQIDLEWSNNSGNVRESKSLKNVQAKLETQSLVIATKMEDARDKAEKLKKEIDGLKLDPKISLEAQNLKAKIDSVSNGLKNSKKEANELIQKIKDSTKLKFKVFGSDSKDISAGFDNIGKKIDKFKTKMIRLIGTAMVFSVIRRGLTALSRGFISILKSNDTFSNSLNQIKENLLIAFTPIYEYILPSINALMNALSRITGTLAVFVASLFGKTASQAKKNAKALYEQANAQNALNSAQENLAGFDKLEVNNDESSSAGVNNLNFNNDIEYDQGLLDFLNLTKQLIVENSDLLLILGAVTAALIAFKVFGLEPIKALGIGVMIFGILELISSLISYLNDPSWENFGKIISSIGLIILGLGIIIGNVPLIIAGVIALILGLIIGNWEKIKNIFQTAISWIYNNLELIKQKFGLVGVFIATIFANILSWGIHTFEDLFGGIKKILDGIIDLVVGVFTGDWKRAWEGIKNIVAGIFQVLVGIIKAPLNLIVALLNGVIDGINFCINGINRIKFDVPDWVPGIGGKKLGFYIPNIGKIPYLATGAVIPPNAQFAAILGDQRHGKNLEAPEGLIRQIVREESGDKEVILNATIVVQCDTGEEFGRATIKGLKLVENIDGKPYLIN